MDLTALFNSDMYLWIILPLLIFLARVLDVSMGTIRFIYISRGLRSLAPIIGFFEVLIWLLAIGQIMQNLDNIFCYIAYGGGFATGTFVGMYIEEKLSIGNVGVRVITRKDAPELIEYFETINLGVTTVDAQGTRGDVKIIYTIIPRHDLKKVIGIIKKFNPKAFYTIEDIKFVSETGTPSSAPFYKRKSPRLFRFYRKGK